MISLVGDQDQSRALTIADDVAHLYSGIVIALECGEGEVHGIITSEDGKIASGIFYFWLRP